MWQRVHPPQLAFKNQDHRLKGRRSWLLALRPLVRRSLKSKILNRKAMNPDTKQPRPMIRLFSGFSFLLPIFSWGTSWSLKILSVSVLKGRNVTKNQHQYKSLIFLGALLPVPFFFAALRRISPSSGKNQSPQI